MVVPNDTATQYAAIHYPHQRTTIRPAVCSYHCPNQPHCIHPVARKLLFISRPAKGRRLQYNYLLAYRISALLYKEVRLCSWLSPRF